MALITCRPAHLHPDRDVITRCMEIGGTVVKALCFAAVIALRASMARLQTITLDIFKNLPERFALEYFRAVHLQPPRPGIAEQVEQGTDNLAYTQHLYRKVSLTYCAGRGRVDQRSYPLWRRVAGRNYSRQAPSELLVKVSLLAAQALLTPVCGRGLTTVNPWLWTWAWQLGWSKTRLSARSEPP
jgi:hypothetical protein